MDYPEFRETIFQNIQELIPDDVTIRLLEVEKLNGSLRYGILFTKENAFFSPTIYLESFYGAYLKGEDSLMLAKELLRCYNEETIEPTEAVYHLADYEYIRENIFVKLINFKENENLLRDTPYQMYLDFAIIPYYELNSDEMLQGTIIIKDKFLESWKITSEELFEWAIPNTKDKKEVYFVKIVDFLDARLTEKEKLTFEKDSNKMYVLTNEKKHLGAILICYPEVLQMIERMFEENYYLLPASIHEWIILPESSVDDSAYLKWIVEQVNRTELLPEEVLSDNVYFYDFVTQNILIC